MRNPMVTNSNTLASIFPWACQTRSQIVHSACQWGWNPNRGGQSKDSGVQRHQALVTLSIHKSASACPGPTQLCPQHGAEVSLSPVWALPDIAPSPPTITSLSIFTALALLLLPIPITTKTKPSDRHTLSLNVSTCWDGPRVMQSTSMSNWADFDYFRSHPFCVDRTVKPFFVRTGFQVPGQDIVFLA